MMKGSAFSLFLKLNQGLVKSLSLLISTILLLHFAACIFCGIAKYDLSNRDNWIHRYKLHVDFHQGGLNSYMRAFYFCFVTLTTVGYGDVVPKTKCIQPLIQLSCFFR